jgi:hypothetical protein
VLLSDGGVTAAPVRLPTFAQIRSYLKYSGWEAQLPGAAGTLWIRDGLRIGVPDLPLGDREIARGIIARLANFERSPADQMASKIRYHRMDVTYLRAANDYAITDTIPFEAASTVIVSARKLLRASGTTAWRERGEIGGNYARRGDDVLHSARMDHTKDGSFVIPLLVPLSAPEEREMQSDPLPNVELFTSQPEPFERRVTRTFAQSIQAVAEIIVQPENSPSMSDLHAVVERGVSREFCAALAHILAEPAVGEFETTFGWAESVPASENMPTSVTIQSEAVERIEQAAEKLKKGRMDTRSTFSGDIVELRHVTDEPYGFIWISTIRRGRRSEIRVRLPFVQYQEALTWHHSQRVVIIEGRVELGVGRRLVVDNPINCRPIDEIFLPVEP